MANGKACILNGSLEERPPQRINKRTNKEIPPACGGGGIAGQKHQRKPFCEAQKHQNGILKKKNEITPCVYVKVLTPKVALGAKVSQRTAFRSSPALRLTYSLCTCATIYYE